MDFNCRRCDRTFKARGLLLGQKTKCPYCGALFSRRLGVALSGGGLRASFFHIGVLAQMARQDMLRHVEVISTVSGGSIIGAFYYLHVKYLLQRKQDSDIIKEDYCRIVKEIERDFFEAVQQNLRVRSLLPFWKFIWTGLPHFSRTNHLGDLLDTYFFRPVMHGNQKKQKLMRELRIDPKNNGEKRIVVPEDLRECNNRRKSKVPALFLNATALNTGHNWYFTPTLMGEPPFDSDLRTDIDKLYRLRRPKCYEQLSDDLKNFTLGHAVAASCCVPGLFPPMPIKDMYDGGIQVQLVDGGVHDNQGVNTLVEWECTDYVISDGSQQMRVIDDPATRMLPVLRRSSGILASQLRTQALLRLIETGQRIAFMHLCKGLSAIEVPWLHRDGEPDKEKPGSKNGVDEGPHSDFGVHKELQDALSRIRTDLDAFTEVEAHSLMLNAYLMSNAELQKLQELIGDRDAQDGSDEPGWTFLRLKDRLAPALPQQPDQEYLKLLKNAECRHFKLFRWYRWRYPWRIGTIFISLLAGGAWMTFGMWDRITSLLAIPIPLGALLATVAIIGLIVLPQVMSVDLFPSKLRQPCKWVYVAGRVLTRAVLAPFVWAVSRLQIDILDPRYQRVGRLDRIGLPPEPEAVPFSPEQELELKSEDRDEVADRSDNME